MAVETDEDRTAFVRDFGVDIVWTRAGVAQPPLRAIVDRPTVVLEHEPDTAGALGRAATLSCPLAALPAGAAEGDPVVVAGLAESFACSALRPDGTGWCVVDLKRV